MSETVRLRWVVGGMGMRGAGCEYISSWVADGWPAARNIPTILWCG